MKILITGSSGYVGSYLIPFLRKKYPNYKLYGLDTGFYFQDLSADITIPEIHLDGVIFRDMRQQIKYLPKDIDTVIHLASLSNDPLGNINTKLTEEINVKGTQNLIKILNKKKFKKLIFASSCSVYGYSNYLVNEESKLNPLTSYSVSKVQIENYLRKKNFKSISLRFATACGFSPRIRLDLVLNDFVVSALYKKKISILSNGLALRPLIDVHDMCASIDWAVHRYNRINKHEVFNVGKNSNNIRIIDLAETVKKNIPNCKIEILKKKDNDSRSYKVDFTKFNIPESKLTLLLINKVPVWVIVLLFTFEDKPPPTKYVTVSVVFDGTWP